MNKNVANANSLFLESNGTDQIFSNPLYNFNYTERIRDFAISSDSYWIMDIIASYQKSLMRQPFQVWKLEREYSYTIIDNIKVVIQRKAVFNIICHDGNNNILATQNIPLSDFEYDEYTVWLVDGLLLLPSEY
jgi:hypothetical protein